MERQLLFYVIGQFILVACGDLNDGMTYYVRPSQSSQCPHPEYQQPCETLQYYLNNMTMLNQQKSITMIFLNGYHNVTSLRESPDITVPVITMIGESEDVISYYGYELHEEFTVRCISFANGGISVIFKNLTLIQWAIQLPKPEYIHISSIALINCSVFNAEASHHVLVENSVSSRSRWEFKVGADSIYSKIVLNNCTFHDTVIDPNTESDTSNYNTSIQINNCTFVNTPLNVHSKNIRIILSGCTVFKDTKKKSALHLEHANNIIFSGKILFVNNSGVRGGAMALYSSTPKIAPNTVVTFINNKAKQWGGAIYVAPGIIPNMVLNDPFYKPPCFYQLLNCSTSATSTFFFDSNNANISGDDIYGISRTDRFNECNMAYYSCQLNISKASSTNSSISSDPLRVCLCDNGKPQYKKNFYFNSIIPGENFTLLLVVVGGEFGLTVGTVYANIYQPTDHYYIAPPSISPGTGQAIRDTSVCQKVSYTLYSRKNSYVTVILTAALLMNPDPFFSHCFDDDDCFLKSPIFINFTILSCPPGFTIAATVPSRCDCFTTITQNVNVLCHIANRTGYISWEGDLWMNVQENETIYCMYCPHNYCKKGKKQIDVQKNSSSQCDFNRSGKLCSQCNEGYSLAIGSSNCIHCKSNNNLALIIFFAAAGFLLVLFIGALNITVTQGKINGLIFYANIIWTYKDIFFPQVGSKNAVMIFLKIFIAWLNLDFGIETCFVKGLTAFWMTWLQFIFPFYIWSIAGLIIVAARCSTRLTNLLGNRAVPLLATIFFLSYMKLLRIVVSSLEFSILSRIDYATGSISPIIVWSVDGSLGYFEFPHILLFLAGLVTLLLLWMPYTLLLFLMQWIRRLPQHGLLNRIMQLHPLYDAYFAPLKQNCHYWFGVLLLARGILLVTFASSFAISQDINLLLLLILGMLLVYYMALSHPYKSTGILVLQSSYLMNLTIISGFFFFSYRQPDGSTLQSVAIGLSSGVAFLQFLGTVIHTVIAPWCCKGQRSRPYEKGGERCDDHKAKRDVDKQIDGGYRDSILDDSDDEPLLPTY